VILNSLSGPLSIGISAEAVVLCWPQERWIGNIGPTASMSCPDLLAKHAVVAGMVDSPGSSLAWGEPVGARQPGAGFGQKASSLEP